MRSHRLSDYRMEWLVRQRMREVGITTLTELHERLKLVDPGAVNFSRFSDMVNELPQRLTVRTLLGLTIVFECEVGDLLRVRAGT